VKKSSNLVDFHVHPLYTLEKPHHLEEEIKKSRFLTRAFPLASMEDFALILADIKAEGPTTHHCFAWKFDSNFRFSDDGEPSGTAGRPILAAIEGRDCDRIAIIVTRWYGGTKLGTGGLARAYGGGAARLLAQASLVEIVAVSEHELHIPFTFWPRFEKAIDDFSGRIHEQNFDALGVKVTVTLPQDKTEDLAQFLRDISRGKIIL